MADVASPLRSDFNGGMSDRHFDEMVRAHHRSVYAYARSMTRSNTLAEEATQDTFVKAWKYLDSFRGDGSQEGWLIRICRNCVLDLIAREAKADVVSLQPVVEPPDFQAEVFDVLDRLAASDREVLVICGVLGFDYETAASILDVPVGTIRSRLSRARAHLADSMREAEAG